MLKCFMGGDWQVLSKGWLEWLNAMFFLFRSDWFEIMDAYYVWAVELLINSEVWYSQINVLETAVFV